MTLPSLTSFSKDHRGTPFEGRLQELPWVETALVVSTLALLTLALLIQVGGVSHVGTISNQLMESILYSGSGALTLILIGRLIHLACQSVKEEKSLLLTSETVTPAKPLPFVPLPQQEEEHEPSITEEAFPSEVWHEETPPMSWDTPGATAHPAKCSFLLNGQMATLYGMYDQEITDIQRFEKNLIQELQSLKDSSPEALKQFFQKRFAYLPDKIVLRIGDTLVVSGKNFIVLQPKSRSKHEQGTTLTTILQIPPKEEIIVILGSNEAIYPISVVDAHFAYEDASSSKNPRDVLAARLIGRIPAEEYALMVLPFKR